MSALTGPNFKNTTADEPRGWVVLSTSTVYKQAMIARYLSGANQGYADNVGAAENMAILGVSRQNGGAQPSGNTLTMSAEVLADEVIIPIAFNSSITTANRNQVVYGIDSGTGSLSPADGIPVGVLMEIIDSTHGKVGVGPTFVSRAMAGLGSSGSSGSSGGAPQKPIARATISAIGTYAYAAGVITATANNATLTADGVTKAVDDVYWLPPGIAAAAADVGLYVLTQDTGSSAKFILTRHPFMPDGATLPSGTTIEVGGEGSSVPNFANNVWKATGAAGAVGTADLSWYPRKQSWAAIVLAAGTYTLGHGGGGEKIYLISTTRAVQVSSNTHAGTIGTSRIEAPAANRTAGNGLLAALVINSLVDAGTVAGSDTSTVDVSWDNW